MQPITDIEGLLIHRFSFKEAIAGVGYSLFDYNYLSIIPDGAINPLVNFPGHTQTFEEDFYLTFEHNEKLFINGEMLNIPVSNHRTIRITYQSYSMATAALQGGYGYFYLVLSRTRIPVIKKFVETPSWCYNTQIAASSNVEYWFGVDKPDAGYSLGIPYLPLGFQQVSYIVYSDAINFRVTFAAYAKCFNNTPLTIFNVVANTALTSANIFGANRFHIDIQNNDGSAKYVKVGLIWLNRSMG